MGISVTEFLAVLYSIDKPAPKTYDFDVTKKLGQKDRRWWDKIVDDRPNFSKQKYHVFGAFLCVAHHDWRIPVHCKQPCDQCYTDKKCNPENNPISEERPRGNLKAKFNMLNKTEMYLWFVEAFELLKGEELDELFKKTEEKYRETKCIRDIRNLLKYDYKITWELIETKAIALAKSINAG